MADYWHMRFPHGSTGRRRNEWVVTHAVYDHNLKSLCGRDAADWSKVSDAAKVDCEKCLDRLNGPVSQTDTDGAKP